MLRSSAAVSAAVLSSRVLGLARDMFFAALFGISRLTDAYHTAFRIPNLLRDLFAEGALSSAFVPTFADALTRETRQRAYALANLVLSGVLIVTGGLTILGIVFADRIVALLAAFGTGTPQFEAATLYARIMMPVLALVSVSAVWMGMLNAHQKFLVPAFAPALFNVVAIIVGVGLMLLPGVPEHQAMIVWSIGTVAAGMAQAAVLLPSLWRLQYRPRLALRGLLREPAVRRIVRLMGPATLGMAAIQINVFVNTHFATALGTGPLSALSIGFRLFYLPIGLFGVALATVTTARASQDAAKGDRPALVERIAEGARGIWLLALPSAVGLTLLAEPIVQLLFQWRRFSSQDTELVVPVVRAYMLGVLPYSLVKVFAPAFYAVNRPRIPMIASAAAVAANILFNWLTYRTLGAPGIAFGTTIAAFVNLALLRLSFGRIVGRPTRRGWVADVSRLLLANAVLAGVALGAWWCAARLLDAASGRLPWGLLRAGHGIFLFATIGLGFLSYVAVLRLLRFRGADELWELPRRLGRRFSSRASRR